METQNITLALPKALLRRAKVVAAERETSISALVAASLEQIVLREDRYESAAQRILARIEKGYNLGTGGRVDVTRDELHER